MFTLLRLKCLTRRCRRLEVAAACIASPGVELLLVSFKEKTLRLAPVEGQELFLLPAMNYSCRKWIHFHLAWLDPR